MIRRPPRSTLFPYPTLSRSAASSRSSATSTASTSVTSGPARTRSVCSRACARGSARATPGSRRSEEHTSELQSRQYLVCRLLLEKKKKSHQVLHYLLITLPL